MDVIKENWDLIKETLRKEYELSDISYSTWIIPLTFHQVKDNVVIIVIPSDQAHALNYISSKYRSYFQVTISEMFDHTYDVAFVLEKDIENEKVSDKYNVSEIFCCSYAPYFYEGIKIRYPEYTREKNFERESR